MTALKMDSYNQFLQQFEGAVRADKVKVCPLCNGLLHLLVVNKYTWFWVHHGTDLKKCADANKTFHKPIIANNLGFYNKMTGIWNEIVAKNNRKVKKQK